MRPQARLAPLAAIAFGSTLLLVTVAGEPAARAAGRSRAASRVLFRGREAADPAEVSIGDPLAAFLRALNEDDN